MAKAAKTKKPRAKQYDEPLKVNGSFMDIMRAAGEHQKANTAKKAAEKKKEG